MLMDLMEYMESVRVRVPHVLCFSDVTCATAYIYSTTTTCEMVLSTCLGLLVELGLGDN